MFIDVIITLLINRSRRCSIFIIITIIITINIIIIIIINMILIIIIIIIVILIMPLYVAITKLLTKDSPHSMFEFIAVNLVFIYLSDALLLNSAKIISKVNGLVCYEDSEFITEVTRNRVVLCPGYLRDCTVLYLSVFLSIFSICSSFSLLLPFQFRSRNKKQKDRRGYFLMWTRSSDALALS